MDREKFRPAFIGYPANISKFLKKIVEKKRITQDQFVENYQSIKEAIRATISWQNYNRARHEMNLYDDVDIRTVDVVAYNDWAKPENMTEELKLFLKLNGEEV